MRLQLVAGELVADEEVVFEALGLERECWSTATPIREIFREAFTRAGLPYFNPHSFRNTLAQLGERCCATPEAFKSRSENLGHEGVLTTLTSYGAVEPARQARDHPQHVVGRKRRQVQTLLVGLLWCFNKRASSRRVNADENGLIAVSCAVFGGSS